MQLKVILEPGEDGYIVASCPALPGCYSQGKTEEEALANIREAIAAWLLAGDDLTQREVKKHRKGRLVEVRV